jgi:hemolysin activation/secretion protein
MDCIRGRGCVGGGLLSNSPYSRRPCLLRQVLVHRSFHRANNSAGNASDLPSRLHRRPNPGPGAISLPSTVAPAGAANIAVIVRDVRITGSTIYGPQDLLPLYQSLLRDTVTVQAVYDLVRAITAKYGNDGYVLSRAVVPPQRLDPKGATVHIEIVEGYVDRVEWPSKLSRYRDFFSSYATEIASISDSPLEQLISKKVEGVRANGLAWNHGRTTKNLLPKRNYRLLHRDGTAAVGP